MNKILDNYIQKLLEINNKKQTLNAPEFAYYTLYGYVPSGGIRGRGENHPKKYIDEIEIDRDIPTKAIKELFKIKDIEMRSSCQGSSKERPSFIIFRPQNQKESYVKSFVKKLDKQKNIKASYNLGKKNKFRICITGYTWAGKDDNEEWWISLSKKIKNSL